MSDQHTPVQNPLTLVMTAKSDADYVALTQTIEGLQAGPAEHNPVVTALNKLDNVHFARFVFFGDNKIGVITTYDNGFDAYITEFANELGGVFDTLLSHVVDAPPLPVQDNRDEFLRYVRDHDLRCVGPFYSAYPDRTVLDIVGVGAPA
ncbi:MAG: hypothetical protein JWO67_3737 [Streptosporangiaceae bacterium]|nr:hypothetical protein [Streptosporangiaceae bacterium]